MKRGHLTKSEYASMLAAQDFLCAKCRRSSGPFEADHHIPNVWEAGKPTQLLCVICHKEKTKRDIKAIAKVRRFVYKKTQFDKRKAAGGTRIKSRGFSNLRKKFDGSVRER